MWPIGQKSRWLSLRRSPLPHRHQALLTQLLWKFQSIWQKFLTSTRHHCGHARRSSRKFENKKFETQRLCSVIVQITGIGSSAPPQPANRHLQSLTTWARMSTHCACADKHLRGGREDTGKRRTRLRGAGLRGACACAAGPAARCVVIFETSGGETAAEAAAGAVCPQQAPLSWADLAMALQLAREQGITLRGSAEIVAEFFCESSRRTR
jgi:hypothetical protein